MKKLYFLSILGIVGLFGTTSCKKYTCTCIVSSYDSSGYYVSTTETHTVKARGVLRAESKCATYNNSNSSCSVIN